MVNAVIFGAGDMAYGLCRLFKNHNYNVDENRLAVTKPAFSKQYLKRHQTFHDTGVPLVHMEDAMFTADIVILAIPSHALKPFLNTHFIGLKNKILVDVTNSSVPGEDLQSMLGLTNARWVKAFNDNGAVDILLDKPYAKKSLVTTMCGKDLEAVRIVKDFAEEALGFHVKIVPHARYQDIAMNQDSLGEDWVHAAYLTIFIFILCEIYALVRYNVWKGYEWFHLPVQVTNKAMCWTALTSFALSMVSGIMAQFHDIVHANKMTTKPKWIVWGFKIRKQLGLIGLWFLGIHIVMSLLIFNQKYYGKFFIDPDANSSKLNKIGEFSFFFGIIGAGLYFILGICSLPSVGSQMTSKSWQFVYGPVAWVALTFGTSHVLTMGVLGWPQQETWPGNLPPITMMSVLIPMLVIFLKAVQVWASWIAASQKDRSDEKYSVISSADLSGFEDEDPSDMEEPTTALVLHRGPPKPVGRQSPVDVRSLSDQEGSIDYPAYPEKAKSDSKLSSKKKAKISKHHSSGKVSDRAGVPPMSPSV